MSTVALQYCCPLCKGALASEADAYHCAACARRFPVVWGIPDFRVFPDPYISIEDDHRKGLKLAERFESENVEGLMRQYWSMTPDTPPELAARYVRYDLVGVERGRQVLGEVQPFLRATSRVLEVGSRTGGFLVAAAEQFEHVVGSDIAFRWLVVAKRWLADQGRSAQLVCCCAQFLPLRDEQFDLVVAGNVIEHTREPQPLMSEARRVLVGGGTFYASTCNRYSIGPEPHVRVWGVGWLPRRWMDGYVRAVRGAPYEHVRLISLLELRRLSRNAGFGKTIVDPPPVGASQRHGLPARERWMLSAYNTLRRWPGVRQMLLLVGPLLRMICVKGASDARSSASYFVTAPPSDTIRSAEVLMRTIAIAGLGAAAKTIHLPAYKKLADLRVVGGFDPAARAEDYAFPLFPSAAELIERAKPDIFAVVTPPVSHQELCTLALEAGCHVFCEKPFMPSLQQAREVCELARRVDRRIVVNNQYRFMNIHRQAKACIGSPEFGELLFLSAQQTFRVSEVTEAGWRGNDPRRTCKEFGVHVLDLCRFFFDEDPATITARMPKPRNGSGPDLLNLIQLEFSNDRVAHITLDRLARGPQSYLNMRLDGSTGCIQTRLGGGAEFAIGIRGSSRKPYVRLDVVRGGESRLFNGDASQRIAEAPFDLFAHGTAELMRAFLDALDRNERPPCDGEDNARTLALVFAAYESDAQRSTIRMNYDA